MSKDQDFRQDTYAVRGGINRSEEGEHSEALLLTSSYIFPSAEEAAARMAEGQPGNVYSRYTNPTVRTFEERIAALEGAEAGVATASGMAAILSTFMALLEAGDHIVCSRDVFGSTTNLLTKHLSKFGISTTFVALTDLDAWKSALQPETKLLFLESPSNPLCEVADIAAISALAKQHGAWLVVDNCFATPVLQKPLELGADIVIHSATKYIDGQGRCLGGAVVGSKESMAEVLGFIRSCGPCMSPFNAWVFLKGLETLRIRMQAHSASAQELAEWLQIQPEVTKVHYAGLQDHPCHELAARQMSAFSGVLSFEVGGGRQQAWTVIDSVKLLSVTANLGDAKSTIIHPATTTHGRLTDQQRTTAGITQGLVRISVGLEDIEDIKADLRQALDQLV